MAKKTKAVEVDHAQKWIGAIAGRVDVRPDGCHVWLGTKVGKGYGRIQLDGTQWRAHRAAFHFNVGPVPDGMHVLHRCDNMACVNPAHLFLGTNADNVADKMAKGRHRAANGERQGHAKLTDEQARNILHDQRMQRVIAHEYGVSKATICMLKQRKTWAHL